MLPLAYQIKSYIKEIFSCICRKGFNIDDNNKKYHKARDHCHCNEKCRRAAHSICNLRYKTPKKLLQYFILVLHMTIIL